MGSPPIPPHRTVLDESRGASPGLPDGRAADGARRWQVTTQSGDNPRGSGKKTGVKYAQFSLVGGSNALVDIGVLNLLLSPTRGPEVLVVCNVAALVLTNANSYPWNTLWTFRGRARHDARQVGLFTFQGLLNVAVGALLIWLVAHGPAAYTDLSPPVGDNVAKVVSMVAASTMSFLFLRFFVFGKAKR